MKNNRGSYYLGRVNKFGLLDQEKFKLALDEPITIARQKYLWTITDFKTLHSNGSEFFFGYLTKFMSEGVISKLDRIHHSMIEHVEPDMIIASSPFLYVPKYSGIVYLHIWNQIQQDIFVKRFEDLIKEKYDGFFMECEIESITDLRSFYHRISELRSIERVNATIYPPNPRFGKYWKSLNDYLKQRNTSDMKIDERCDPGKSINSNLQNIIYDIIEEKDISDINSKKVDIGDAAILMAADGYGHGKVEGIEGSRTVVISTKERKLSILFDKEPDPLELYNKVEELFINIQKQRHMDH
jgi:hypothetical protein